MAQQDTGLGWSAKSEWLTSAPAIVGTIKTGGVTDPVPVRNPGAITADNAVQELYPLGVYYRLYPSNEAAYPLLTSDNAGAFPPVGAFIYISPPYAYVVYFCETDPSDLGATGCVAFTGNPATLIFSTTDASRWILNTNTGFYYKEFQLTTGASFNVGTLPVFNTLQDGLNSFVGSELPIYKLNAGPAVVCAAKWKTANGTELTSPILISSNTEFVDMTMTGTGYSMAKFNKLLSGTRFYMAFWDIPGDKTILTSFQQIDLTDRGNMDLEQLFMTIVSSSYAHVIIINSPDPYSEEGADSGEEGGDGEDLEDDEMGISHHAIPAAINTGFCRIYCPSEQQLRDLSNYLWSAQYDLAAVKKLFANPMDSVLGLSAVPLTLGGANRPVYLGGVDTEMSFPMVDYQSYQVPMGAITVEKRWGSYLDYDPYTRFSIFLPFIGFKDLSADDIMGKQIILDYDVDILSGACTARLQAGGNVLYQWSGQCSIQLPVTASNWNQVFQGATSAALSAGLSVATGTAGPVLAGALAAEGVQAIMGKPRIERGGTASGAAGWMGGLTPYLVRVTPQAIIPSDQNKFIGYPAFSSISLGNLTGYNEISSIHLEGIPATGAELEELEAILKGGVIF